MSTIAPTQRAQEDVGFLSPQEKRELVQRVVDSQMFRRSAALRAFLLYITNYEILGQADKLKEQMIGVEVLGRKADYLPMTDNIVRVRAHELRGRLERYFASEGTNEPVVITMPAGSYAPKFVPRKTAEVETPAISLTNAAEPSANGIGHQWRRYGLLFIVIVLIALSVSVALVRYSLTSEHRSAARQPSSAMQDFWGQFFDTPNEELNVVYADPGFALWQDMSGKTLNLGDYLNHKYLNADDDKLLKEAVRRMASPADIVTVGHLGTLAGQFGGQINVQFARDVSAKFFQRGNIVLLGSRRSNPWVELYESSLNFRLEQDPHSGEPQFRNRSPRSGEASVYAITAGFDGAGGNEKEYTRYGVAALLERCGNRDLTVLAEGLNTQATQAVGDMLTDPQRLDALLRSIGHKPGTKVAPFEALIQITSFPNDQYDDAKVIAFRLRPPEFCVGD